MAEAGAKILFREVKKYEVFHAVFNSAPGIEELGSGAEKSRLHNAAKKILKFS